MDFAHVTGSLASVRHSYVFYRCKSDVCIWSFAAPVGKVTPLNMIAYDQRQMENATGRTNGRKTAEGIDRSSPVKSTGRSIAQKLITTQFRAAK